MGNFIDLTGQKFGRLLVIKRDFSKIVNNGEVIWLCQCDCGNIVIIQGSHLKNGHTKSCGCFRRELITKKARRFDNLIGMIFGRLIVVELYLNNNEKNNGIYWLCKCNCGKFCIVKSENLKNGHTKSCGCLRRETSSEIGKIYGGNFFKDLTGLRFGRLVVINFNYISIKNQVFWNCLCDCGKTTIVNTNGLNTGHTQSCGCLRKDSQLRGENSPKWKGGINPENTRIRMSTEYNIWRKSVFERDNYTCQECGAYGVKLNAHHINSFAKFPEERFNVGNGITLCVDCHKNTDNYGSKAITVNLQNIEFICP